MILRHTQICLVWFYGSYLTGVVHCKDLGNGSHEVRTAEAHHRRGSDASKADHQLATMVQKTVAKVSEKLAASFLEQQAFVPDMTAAKERAEEAMQAAMSENVTVDQTAGPKTPPPSANTVADLVKQFEKLAGNALGFSEEAENNRKILDEALSSLNEATAAAAQANLTWEATCKDYLSATEHSNREATGMRHAQRMFEQATNLTVNSQEQHGELLVELAKESASVNSALNLLNHSRNVMLIETEKLSELEKELKLAQEEADNATQELSALSSKVLQAAGRSCNDSTAIAPHGADTQTSLAENAS